MTLVDFIIGATLMNAMPHFVLGVWKGRVFSAFGFGDGKNILYGLLNFGIALALFLYRYGLDGLWQNGLFTGALAILVIYFLSGRFWYFLFHQRYYNSLPKYAARLAVPKSPDSCHRPGRLACVSQPAVIKSAQTTLVWIAQNK